MKPEEVYNMSLSEYNNYMNGCEEKIKNEIINCILTGYYVSYYMNSGRKAKSPKELIQQLFRKKETFEDGLKAINRIKELEEAQSGRNRT